MKRRHKRKKKLKKLKIKTKRLPDWLYREVLITGLKVLLKRRKTLAKGGLI